MVIFRRLRSHPLRMETRPLPEECPHSPPHHSHLPPRLTRPKPSRYHAWLSKGHRECLFAPQPGTPGRTMMDRRQFVAGSAAAATSAAGRQRPRMPTHRAPSPSSIRFRPAGAADVVARPLAAVMEPLIKQPIVIETKAGAAGAVGAQYAAAAKPDGYTLLDPYRLDLRLLRGRPALRPAGEVQQRRFHPDRPVHRRPDGAGGQRPAALQDAARSSSTPPRPSPTS